MLERERCVDKFRPLDILYEIFNGYARFDNMIYDEKGEMIHLTVACRNKISENKDRIERLEVVLEKDLEIKADLLDLIDNPSPLFPSEEELRALIAELERLRKL